MLGDEISHLPSAWTMGTTKCSISDEDAVVAFNSKVADGIFLLGLRAPFIANSACPGQFVMIRVRDALSPLLRRPFSICGATGDTVKILYAVVGDGTRILSGAKSGDVLRVLGPLGKGFDAPFKDREVFFVGGGMGIAPLLFSAQRHGDVKAHFLAGFRSGNRAIDFSRLGFSPPRLHVFTEDGSLGLKGFPTELLSDMLEVRGPGVSSIYACGPIPMLRAVVKLGARHNTSCAVSLESGMACGVGACQGCVVPAAGGGYLRVCKEGPVFDSERINWEAL